MRFAEESCIGKGSVSPGGPTLTSLVIRRLPWAVRLLEFTKVGRLDKFIVDQN